MPRPNSKQRKPDNRISVRLRDDQLKALRKRTNPDHTEADLVRAALDAALRLRRPVARC